jgi:hypothetical protein
MPTYDLFTFKQNKIKKLEDGATSNNVMTCKPKVQSSKFNDHYAKFNT